MPRGRKTKETKETKENLTASFRVFKDLFASSINLLKNLLPERSVAQIKITYLVADTAYGGLDYLKIAQEYGCNLISKRSAAQMKSNVALYEPAKKEKGKKGRPPLYGNKIDLAKIDEKYLKKTEQKREKYINITNFQHIINPLKAYF